jgi:hypothetical protein
MHVVFGFHSKEEGTQLDQTESVSNQRRKGKEELYNEDVSLDASFLS